MDQVDKVGEEYVDHVDQVDRVAEKGCEEEEEDPEGKVDMPGQRENDSTGEVASGRDDRAGLGGSGHIATTPGPGEVGLPSLAGDAPVCCLSCPPLARCVQGEWQKGRHGVAPQTRACTPSGTCTLSPLHCARTTPRAHYPHRHPGTPIGTLLVSFLRAWRPRLSPPGPCKP